jgi:hypothetical protein
VPGSHELLCVKGHTLDTWSTIVEGDEALAKVPGAQTTQTRSAVAVAAVA